MCNMAYDQADKERKLQLQELEELCLEAYENSWIYKKKVKQFHDNRILRKEFRVGQKVLLFHSRLKLIVGKLRSRWDGPFVITNVFTYATLELRHEANNRNFKVNGHQINPFHEGPTPMVGNSLQAQKPKNHDQPKPWGSKELWNCFGSKFHICVGMKSSQPRPKSSRLDEVILARRVPLQADSVSIGRLHLQ
ncbi:hypothetical protein CR513_27922, partial [Mucuna pruriens]